MSVEEPLSGGEVNEVVRVGETVHRTSGRWTPAVQSVLGYLRAAGFDQAPEPLGIDDQGREVVSYLPGTPALRPWPEVLLRDEGVHQVAAMVARLSDLLAAYPVPAGSVWRHGGVPGQASVTLRHGDLGLWNTVWTGDRLVGLIDWDYLEPAPLLWDFAQLCWYAAPLRPYRWQSCGFAGEPDWRHRMEIIACYAGVPAAMLAQRLLELQELDRQRTLTWGSAGIHPWDRFLAEGFVEDIAADAGWLRAQTWD